MLAAYHGHPELVRSLIKHGADPNRLNDRLQSPLAGAIFKKEEDVIKVRTQRQPPPPPLSLAVCLVKGLEYPFSILANNLIHNLCPVPLSSL